MKVIVFDTETTGLPTGARDEPYANTTKWPHIVQLSYVVFDTVTQTVMKTVDDIIRIDDSVDLTERSIEVHGITRQRSRAEGIDIVGALNRFVETVRSVDCIVGHNVRFDKDIVSVEGIRHGIFDIFAGPIGGPTGKNMPEYCTMMKGKAICGIEVVHVATGRTYFKQPRLTELHDQLFGMTPEGTHNALVDVLVCLRCYMTIRWAASDIVESSPSFATAFNSAGCGESGESGK